MSSLNRHDLPFVREMDNRRHWQSLRLKGLGSFIGLDYRLDYFGLCIRPIPAEIECGNRRGRSRC